MPKRYLRLWLSCRFPMVFRCATLVLAFVVAAGAQTRVKQGEVLRISADGATARLIDKSIRLFAQPEGGKLGLMPIPVTLAPGSYKIKILDGRGAAFRDLEITVLDAHYPKQNIAAS